MEIEDCKDTWRGYRSHVFPLNDTREHILTGTDCWCQPTVDDDLVIHNSADRREVYEQHPELRS